MNRPVIDIVATAQIALLIIQLEIVINNRKVKCFLSSPTLRDEYPLHLVRKWRQEGKQISELHIQL
jgi:hypothetical protein